MGKTRLPSHRRTPGPCRHLQREASQGLSQGGDWQWEAVINVGYPFWQEVPAPKSRF